jgi:hypothetical protein
MHDGLDQQFLNIEGQSGVVNNILKIAFSYVSYLGFCVVAHLFLFSYLLFVLAWN